jgi:hypothetical protein
MPNFPGATNALPGVYSEVVTNSRGVAVPGGVRLTAILGEGAREEVLISAAVGGGNDGLNPAYSSTNNSDGRHFLLSFVPVVSNRTTLFKNGIPLVGLEQVFTPSSPGFSSSFDYRIDISNGRIELQTASLVDQGGSFYKPNAINVGNGTINGLTLIDLNAPTETWTVRCTSVRRDGYGNPIDGYAKFIATGSVSGNILDDNGNQVVWESNGVVNDNTILQFSITEGSSAFIEGDVFTIEVQSGALQAGDSLVATYISEAELNDPQFFSDIDLLAQKHGQASLANRLTLGAQLAFANGPPGVWALQCAPSLPRRVSYLLEESASGGATADDLSFPLPLNVTPDTGSNINFFVTDPITETETQIVPNKVAFYDPAITADPNSFHFGPAYTYSYTVILKDSVQKQGDDGALVVGVPTTTAELSSDTVLFTLDDLSPTRSVKILSPAANAGTYSISAVTDGKATIVGLVPFTAETGIEFEVIDSSDQSSVILFTDDLALSAGESLRATVVDTKDADFFDPGWQAGLEALEKIDCDIVVPLPSQTISAIFQAARIHCETMSNIKNRKERVLFIGAIAGLTPENVTGAEPAAVEDLGVLEGIQGDDVTEVLAGNIEDLTDYGIPDNYGNTFRVVYFYPDEVVVQIGADRVKVDGFFQAAAAGGFLSGIPLVSVPLTNKVLTGFSILRDKLYRPITLENLAVAGATVLQPVAGGGRVIWGKTTTQSGFPEEEEISIVFIRDRVSKSMRAAFTGFIGTAEDETTQGSLMARANSVVTSFISAKLITDFRDLKVVRDEVEPRQWNITVAIQPVYPVNWIYIKVSIGLL